MSAFTTIRAVGSALPADLLSATVSDARLEGMRADDYHLEYGVTPREAANRAWSVLTGAWSGYREAISKLPEGDRAVRITREKWLAVLLRELAFGRVPVTPSGGLVLDDRSFPISHSFELDVGHVPLHLLGWGVELDRKTPGQPGAADRAPHAMVQEYLNRTDEALWAMVSNGRVLRMLRDSSTLIGQSYVEFDLEAMFDGEVFSDFVVLFLVCHSSRFETERRDDAAIADCWLERWRTYAAETGTRALQALSPGVKRAVEALGSGFMRHPANDLHHRLGDESITPKDVHEALLRLVYRLLFCFVAEDRGLLLDPDGSQQAKQRYLEWFSTARLRRVATRRRGSGHADLWQSVSLVLDGLATEGGRPELALPGLGGLFEIGEVDVVIGCELGNEPLLTAVRHLTIVQPVDGGPKRTVDYRNLGAEELGSVYESLLEFVPSYDRNTRNFVLESKVGNDRKTSGAYYTPSSLIDCLLDSALDPLLDEAEGSADPEGSLLALTVCDPACGSGHFLVAAAKRIAARVASVRARSEGSDRDEATIVEEQRAMHDVVDRCIFGVDLNPMAAELAKVSLWLESVQPGRALSFLNGHIKVGNALLGATPAGLAGGIPDGAFTALEGDTKKWVASLKKRNSVERDAGQNDLFSGPGIDVRNTGLASSLEALERLPTASLSDVHTAQQRYRDFDTSAELRRARCLADAWCSAFIATKTSDTPAITQSTITRLETGHADLRTSSEATLVDKISQQYKFFHWHLEFPQIFQVGDTAGPAIAEPGWSGGFSCVVGNPPWDTLSPDTREFFGGLVPEIRELSKADKTVKIDELLENEGFRSLWELHRRELFNTAHFLKRSGRYRMYASGNLGKGDFNVYRSFVELALTITEAKGVAGQIMQSGLYSGANSSEIRRVLLEECTWLAVYGFDNKGGSWFEGVALENFAAYAARVGVVPSPDHEIQAAFGLPNPDTLASDLSQRRLTFRASVIRVQNPETFAIPDIRDPRTAQISQRLYDTWPSLVSEHDEWPLRDFSREIDMSDKNNVFSESRDGVPIYEGRMIDFYDHRAKRYVSGHGNSSKWEETPFGSDRKVIWPQWSVKRSELQNDDVRARIDGYRVGFMDIADPGRKRSFTCTVVPPGTVCGHTVPTVLFGSGLDLLPSFTAVANSLVVDFVARQRTTSKHMTFSILDSLPIARLRRDDHRFEWLTGRSLQLTCTSMEMTEFWNLVAESGVVESCEAGDIPGILDLGERTRVRAEIDAYVALEVYELNRPDLEAIIDTFTQLRTIEEKAVDEFRTKRLVLAAYDEMTK